MPRTFQRYEFLNRIGAGGMAEVFRARAFSANGSAVMVVVKRILPHLSDNPEFRKMFVEEARIASSLKHPNIVRMLDLGRIDRHLFIAMEYVDGPDLERAIRRFGELGMRLSVGDALHVTVEVLKGLHYAHTRTHADGWSMNIVHRDVTPGNVLLSLVGSVKVNDFGIAKASRREVNTARGKVKGKLGYIAPEQLVDGAEIGPRTDVYSTGLLLHTMLSGKHPLEDVTTADVSSRAVAGNLAPPSAFDPSVPAELDEIVMKAIRPEVADRWAGASEMRQAIEAYAAKAGLDLEGSTLHQQLGEVFGESLADQEPAPAGAPSIVARVAPMIQDEVVRAEGSAFRTHESPMEATPLAPPKVRAGGNLLPGHSQTITSLAISRDGLTALSGGADRAVKVWDLVARAATRFLPGHTETVSSVSISADGALALSGSVDRTVRLWGLEGENEIATLEGHTGWVNTVALSADGRVAISGGLDRSLHLWRLDQSPIRPVTMDGHLDAVTALQIAPDASWAISGALDRTLRLWDLVGGSGPRTIPMTSTVRALALSVEAALAVVAAGDGRVHVVDLKRSAATTAFTGHTEPVVAVAISDDGKLAASCGFDKTVRVWSIEGVRELARFDHPGPVTAVAFGPGSSGFLLSGCADGTVGIWPIS